MGAKTVLKKLKEHGYWHVNFFPSVFNPELINDPVKCRDIIKQNLISLRGWNYPHVPNHNDEKQELYIAGDKAESWIDWEIFKEVWRFYQSGQFLSLFGVYDDWYQEDSWLGNELFKKVKPDSQLDAVGVVLKMTEILLFTKNMVDSEVYDHDTIQLEIELVNMKGRKLAIMDPRRIPLFQDYICYTDKITLPVKKLSANDPTKDFEKIAMDFCEHIFKQFQWDSFPRNSFEEDQKKLIERRL